MNKLKKIRIKKKITVTAEKGSELLISDNQFEALENFKDFYEIIGEDAENKTASKPKKTTKKSKAKDE